MSKKVEQKIRDLKLVLPDLAKPVGSYVPAVLTGNLVYTSGQLPLTDGRLNFKGRIGQEVTTENAQRAAKIAVINAISAIRWLIKDLDKVKKIVRMTGYLTSAVDYYDQAKVMNAASDLLTQIFGEEIGSHSRVTIGCLELPMGSCLELDLIVQI